MTSVEEQEHRRSREKNFFIPAGALIGLGIGLIAGQPAPGILIGLGLGFIATAFIKPGPPPDPATSHGSDNRWIFVAIGLFMIAIGAGIIWSPANLWPYIIGIFLIVLGSIIAVKSLRNVT
jgi:hypothetical protein